ncbi:DUF3422 family protein [Tropicimonas sp. IMCC34043]|uniref:DUF3422 family protein n=1 Tax=Tropicimonas sp. IMCC34043 TaxID=2248760 RepID=UPI000E27B852|nr:DUF3422 domain-containing protein [Tropicimonas sp. IMCC34043]
MLSPAPHPELADHPSRAALAAELHARPFPKISAPGHVLFLALKQPQDAANRHKGRDLAHLLALLERFGAEAPEPGATHWIGPLGPHRLKWECHTEFTTYTLFIDGLEDTAFDPAAYEILPQDWLAEAPGMRIASALIRVELTDAEATDVPQRIADWFLSESVATSRVLDGGAIVAADFHPDPSGHNHFAVFLQTDVSQSRLGRLVQRLTEIEIYKTMALLGLPRARALGSDMAALDPQLTALVGDMTGNLHPADEMLDVLLEISAKLENLLATSTFRFGATEAYEAIVHDRIRALREIRFRGKQTLEEFMLRRFDPAMRTIRSTELRLRAMADRAARAGELLRTRVDVERQEQNQKLLESMDRRADQALKLQHTVEGLSVVAISYYALNLASYAVYPLLEPLEISKGMATAVLLPLVVGAVFLMVRRIRNRMH